jgi:ketosteroid isomerase-like protein
MPSSITTDARVARVIAAFETLQPGDVANLGALYTEDARFKDPFNEVQGHAALQRVFSHMFVALDEPRFVVTEAIVQGDRCFLVWDFLFRFKRWTREPQAVRGGSHLVFAPDGRIARHRDYWDAAEELYEKLPAVGALMRWLKRRANG